MATTEKERVKLYDGTIEIDYYPNSHRYKLVVEDGQERDQWLKSPSSIVRMLDKSAPLMAWAVKQFHDSMIEHMRDGENFTADDVRAMLSVSKNAYAEKRDEAANVGTVVHFYAQNHFNLDSIESAEGFENLPEADQIKARKGAEAFDGWYKSLQAKSVASEFMVYSKKEGFVGRCDDLVEINGALWILDYKTSKGVYTDQVYQVTSYLKAREEEFPNIEIAGARLVHLCKEDVLDKDGNVIKRAGEAGEVILSRGDLVKAYMVFKALKVIADNDPLIQKLLK